MVKVLKTYESPSKEWIESFEFLKSYEALAYVVRMKQADGTISKEINEVATSNADIIKLRDFLNGLDLGEEN